MMYFQIGETVIHSTHGLGEVVQIEDRVIHDNSASCYVVRTNNLTVWVPVEDGGRHTLRIPTPQDEFTSLFSTLNARPEPLPEDRQERRRLLLSLLQDGQLISICRIVRDLSGLNQVKKLSDEDRTIYDRATNSLLEEWSYSMQIPLLQARQKLNELLS